jgi:transcription elongation GreA/GreB family factor
MNRFLGMPATQKFKGNPRGQFYITCRIHFNMNQQEKIAFKNKLKQFCHHRINERIAGAKAAIENAQEAANSEHKSSAGDKYETGRAMGHLERDMHTKQVSENLKELSTLHAVNTNAIYNAVAVGALVQCANISFFIAVGLGKQVIDSETIVFLSPNAPLAKLLMHKKAGEHFLFNKANIPIKEIY